MQIQRVTLSKWCQLDGTFEFGPGLNSVRGPNGSGKTNLVNSIVFALTGDISRLHGVKTDNVNVLADKKDRAFVQVSFTHENVDGLISRVLQPNPRQELLLMPKGGLPTDPSVKKVTRDAEIEYEIERLLGNNEKMLLDYVFDQQWGIFKFIDQQPSVRARALAELFGADRAERIYKELGDVKIDIPAAAVDADMVRKRIADNKTALADVVAELKSFAGMPEKIEEALKKPREILKRYERREKLLSDIANMEDNILSRKERIDALMFEIKPLLDQHATMKEVLVSAEPLLPEARQTMNEWRIYESTRANCELAVGELNTLKAALDKQQSSMPIKPVNYADKTEKSRLTTQKATITGAVTRYQKILDVFKTSGKLECPTCGTPVSNISDKLSGYENYIRDAKPLLEKIDKSLEATEAYDSAMALRKQTIDKLTAQVEAKQSQVDNTPGAKAPKGNKKVSAELLSNYEATKKKFDYLSETLRIGEGKVNVMKAEIQSIEGMLEKYKVEEKTLADVSQLDATDAADAINQMADRYVGRDTLRNRKRDIERLIEDDEEALDKCKVVQLRGDRLKQAEAHLEEVRNVYKQLITLIPQHNMEELRAEVNDNLDRFNARFRVDAIDDLRFLLRYHSGRVQPAERLSGGERVLLALAFRIAVNSRYAKELGLLCLDEPTAGLDEDNLNCLEVALGRLRELSQARGLQVIMVTHDPGLDGLFDRVIRLQAAS